MANIGTNRLVLDVKKFSSKPKSIFKEFWLNVLFFVFFTAEKNMDVSWLLLIFLRFF